jgi:hypothetical protein
MRSANLTWRSAATLAVGLALVAALGAAGCGAGGEMTRHEAYLNRLVEGTTYNPSHIEYRVHDDTPGERQESQELFEKHKREILRTILPFCFTFDGGEYPFVVLVAYGVRDRTDPDKVSFRLAGKGSFRNANPMSGIATSDDYWATQAAWSLKQGRVTEAADILQRHGALPDAAVDKAAAIAKAYDSRYASAGLNRNFTDWLTARYVNEVVFAKPPKVPRPEMFAAIRENTGHNLISLEYSMGGERYIEHVERVMVDIFAGRVIGVYKTTVDMAPIH